MAVEPDFSEILLAISRDILAAARSGSWELVDELTAQREQLIDSDAGRKPPTAGTEAVWREVARLNEEALNLAQTQLEHVSDGVQSAHNAQRLHKHYGG